MARAILLLLLLTWSGRISSAETVEGADPLKARLSWFVVGEEQEQELSRLVDQLDADSFVDRETASRKLAALPSLPAFVRRIAHTDGRLEVRTRLRGVIQLHPLDRETAELDSILRQIGDQQVKGLLGMIAEIVAAGVWDPDQSTLARAARATVTAADLPELSESLSSDSPSVRHLAAAAFSGLGAEQSSGPLRQLLADPESSIALLAAESLARRNDTASLATFARLLDAPDFGTRHRSWSALKGLSARSFGFDPQAEPGDRRGAARRWQEWSRGPDAAIVGELPTSSAIALFNGRDLSGWTVFENGRAAQAQTTWEAEFGSLVSVGRGSGDIRTNAAFENYVLSLQYKIEGARGDGGVGVMLTDENEGAAIGPRGDAGSYLEVQILPNRTGDLYLIGGFQARAGGRPISFTSQRTAAADDQAGEWHELKLTVRDGGAEIELNGTVVNQATDGSEGPGKIVLRNEGSRIAYRNIMLHPDTP